MSVRLRIPGVKALLAQSRAAMSGPGCLRMRLMTASLAVLILTLAPVLTLSSLQYAGELLGGIAADILTWASYGLIGLIILLVGLPMAAAVYRIAVIESLRPVPAGFGAEDDVPAYASGWEAVGDALRDCFYPFSSARAFGQCLRAGLGWLLRVGELLLLPVLCVLAFRCRLWAFLPLIPAALTAVKTAAVIVTVMVTILLAVFSGSPAVYAFSVLAPADGVRVSMLRVLWGRRGTHKTMTLLRLRMAMWVILSAAAVIVPLFLITLPVCFSVSARLANACLRAEDTLAPASPDPVPSFGG